MQTLSEWKVNSGRSVKYIDHKSAKPSFSPCVASPLVGFGGKNRFLLFEPVLVCVNGENLRPYVAKNNSGC